MSTEKDTRTREAVDWTAVVGPLSRAEARLVRASEILSMQTGAVNVGAVEQCVTDALFFVTGALAYLRERAAKP